MFCCMSLRRFPWKQPRVSDNSYRLFVTQPTEEERKLPGYPQAVQSEPASRQTSELEDEGSSSANRGKSVDGTARSEPTTRDNGDGASTTSRQTQSTTAAASQQPQHVIKGPWRLLRLLPRDTRHIIGRMLELDPKKRATIEEIMENPWVQKTAVCYQEDGGGVVRAQGHSHTLEPGGSNDNEESKKK